MGVFASRIIPVSITLTLLVLLGMGLSTGTATNLNITIPDPYSYQVSDVSHLSHQPLLQQLRYPQVAIYSGNYESFGGSHFYSVPSQPQSITTPKYYTEVEKEALLDSALKAAWDQYGPKSKQKFGGVGSSTYTHRDTSGAGMYGSQLSGFQPWESEWDQHVSPPPVLVQPPTVEPNFINRMLASYIKFEVNHHELADFMRRTVFFTLVGLVVLGWVGLGAWLGLFSLKIFGGAGRKRDVDETEGNSIMSGITDRVMLALDQDWLEKLQERIQKSESSRSWTHVQCCLLPDAKATGITDCHPVKRGNKNSTWKCLSDLIYNFQFGPPQPSGIGGKS